MTTPTPLLPATVFDATPSNPIGYGLYQAAFLDPTESLRLDGGAEIRQINAGGHGTWPTGCTDPDDDAEKTPDRSAAFDEFASVIVWAADGCFLVGETDAEVAARAAQLLRIYEPIEAEEHTAAMLMDRATAPPGGGAPSVGSELEIAVGTLDEALADSGIAGVIHAARRWAAPAHRLVTETGGRLYTPGGNLWAFGGGYSALGNTLYATGPVTVRRSPVSANLGHDVRHNLRLAVSERTVNVSWELGAVYSVPVA